MSKRSTLNNDDRRDWINNDEGLYSWWRSSRLNMADFIKQNKDEIDACILQVRDGKKQAHFLVYG